MKASILRKRVAWLSIAAMLFVACGDEEEAANPNDNDDKGEKIKEKEKEKEPKVNTTRREYKPQKDFMQLVVENGVEVVLKQGEPQKIEVETLEELHEFIQFSATGSSLKVETSPKEKFADHPAPKVYITTQALEKIEINHNSVLRIEGTWAQEGLWLSLNESSQATGEVQISKRLDALTSRRSTLTLTGSVREALYIQADSSEADVGHARFGAKLKDLAAIERANVKASNQGYIELWAGKELSITAVDNQSVVKYYGSPQITTSLDNVKAGSTLEAMGPHPSQQ